ncbi:hypothetical protein SAMN05920897_10385 [Alkalispirochaeta americana]|uniref:Uncharacterized protein n=1 Tax=Alkalispirochaeta americana TaxID=159291 RepID=A0A1N6PQM1_9SPIO|nr:hypothetical protein [Alkalispirochaeta americana]SIQ06472.1 hypothetical protein SAMN05920897_10385 [Alkalispirochaeta americana]
MKTKNALFSACPSLHSSFFLGVAWFFLIFLALGGCYWTPDESRGSISLRIQAPSSGEQVTASDTVGEPAYLLLVYVIEEAFIRQDPEGNMEHIFGLWEASFDEEDFEGADSSPGSLGSISLGTSALASQFQGFAELLGYESSAGGTILFSNLNPDSSYLVVAEVHSLEELVGEGQEDSRYSFRTTTVRSGENRTVNLDLDKTLNQYLEFLNARYGLSEPDDPSDGSIEITANLVNPEDEEIELTADAEVNLDEISELTFTAPEGYDSYEWTVNNMEGWDNSNTITISESEISDVIFPGLNTVDLEVELGGEVYHGTFTFTAIETILGELVIEAILVNPEDEQITLDADAEVNLDEISELTFTAPEGYDSYNWTVNNMEDWGNSNTITISESDISDVIFPGLNTVDLEVELGGEVYHGTFTFTAIETILGELVIEAILVNPEDEEIELTADTEVNIDEITELTFTAPTGYDSYEWTVNDMEGWDNSNTITIPESDISDVIKLGQNTVDLVVEKAGALYSHRFTFTAISD